VLRLFAASFEPVTKRDNPPQSHGNAGAEFCQHVRCARSDEDEKISRTLGFFAILRLCECVISVAEHFRELGSVPLPQQTAYIERYNRTVRHE
jgi:hypothetical protein